jgi:RNA polymerase sigma factor (sigma-70 family)
VGRVSFEEFYRAHYAMVLRFAERRIDQERSLEICSDCFTIAWKDYDEEDPPSVTWLYKTAHHLVGNAYRSRDREQRLMDALEQQASIRDSGGEGMDVAAAMAALSRKDNEVLRLTYWEELSASEVAEVIGCSEQAAWKRISRAKQNLRVALSETRRPAGREDANVG